MDNLHIKEIVDHFPGDTVWIPERFDAKVFCGKCHGSGRLTIKVDGFEYYRSCPICEGRNWGLHQKQYYVYNEYRPKEKVISKVNIVLTNEGTDVRYNVLYDSIITYKPEEVFSSETACRKYCELLNANARKEAEKHVWEVSD